VSHNLKDKKKVELLTLNGDVLWKYTSLTTQQQDLIANSIGSSSQHVIFDLQFLQRTIKFQ